MRTLSLVPAIARTHMRSPPSPPHRARRGSDVAVDAMDKLGTMPKSVRLVEAISQHKFEAPRPKGWVLAVVEAVYKEGAWLQGPGCCLVAWILCWCVSRGGCGDGVCMCVKRPKHGVCMCVSRGCQAPKAWAAGYGVH